MTISLKNFFVRLLFPLSLFCKHYFRLKSCKDIIRCFVLRRSCNFKSDWWHPDIIRKRSIHFRSFYWSIKTVPYCLIIVSCSTYKNSMESKVNVFYHVLGGLISIKAIRSIDRLDLKFSKFWTMDAGHWTLDAGLWSLGSARWILDAGLFICLFIYLYSKLVQLT